MCAFYEYFHLVCKISQTFTESPCILAFLFYFFFHLLLLEGTWVEEAHTASNQHSKRSCSPAYDTKTWCWAIGNRTMQTSRDSEIQSKQKILKTCITLPLTPFTTALFFLSSSSKNNLVWLRFRNNRTSSVIQEKLLMEKAQVGNVIITHS